MTRSLLALAFVFAAVNASAQTVIRHVDLNVLNLGPVVAVPMDDDGNPQTEAWLVRRVLQPELRLVVVQRDGAVCIEDPLPLQWGEATLAQVVRHGTRDVLLVHGPFDFVHQFMRVMTVDRVRCR